MRNKKTWIACSLCLMMACAENKENPSKESTETTTQPSDSSGNTATSESAASRTFTVRPGVRISFTESHPLSMTMSDVAIRIEGDVNAETIIRDLDPIADILEGDLNYNGSKEWYIITSSGGSGSYGNIKAFTFVDGDKLDEILIPDMNAGEGYQGHDTFSIQDDRLIRQFPVYSKDDNNSNPTGGKKEIRYRLKELPGGKYALDPES